MPIKDSANFADIKDSIADSKDNSVQLSNVCTHVILYDNIKLTDSLIFQDYWNILEPTLENYKLKEEFWYKPEAFAKSFYGTSDLWYLVLWTNKMTHPVQFTGTNVKVLPPEQFALINRIIENNKTKLANDADNPINLPDLTLKKLT
jgi:hypothetical protein